MEMVIIGGGGGGNDSQAFSFCWQVDIERSYALVLHKLVRRVNGKLTHSLRQALDEQLSLDANCQISSRTTAAYCGSNQTVVRLQPLTNMYQAQLTQMAGLLDVRVFRRVARELWNAAAGVSGNADVEWPKILPLSATRS